MADSAEVPFSSAENDSFSRASSTIFRNSFSESTRVPYSRALAALEPSILPSETRKSVDLETSDAERPPRLSTISFAFALPMLCKVPVNTKIFPESGREPAETFEGDFEPKFKPAARNLSMRALLFGSSKNARIDKARTEPPEESASFFFEREPKP